MKKVAFWDGFDKRAGMVGNMVGKAMASPLVGKAVGLATKHPMATAAIGGGAAALAGVAGIKATKGLGAASMVRRPQPGAGQ